MSIKAQNICFIICFLCSNNVFSQKLTAVHDSIYRINISVPINSWIYCFDTLDGKEHFIQNRIFAAIPSKKENFKCGTSIILAKPVNCQDVIDTFNSDWNHSPINELKRRGEIIRRGQTINDTIRCLIRKYICDDIHGQIIKSDREKMEFLFIYHGIGYVLDCNTSTSKFHKYKKLFYRVAESIHFE